MTEQEYKNGLKIIAEKYEQEKFNLLKQYVDSQHTYKIGDKFTDHIGTIIIEKIGYAMGLLRIPDATFYGPEITKKGEPKKNGSKRATYLSNEVKQK